MFVFFLPITLISNGSPWEQGQFKGRIALSTDGNYNDEDDWAAGPFALAILAEFGLQEKLVHFDYNCILPKNNPKWANIHKAAIEESAARYGYPGEVFHNCQDNLEAAIQSIADAVNQSTAEDPLYFILAGPMEVPYLGIQRADPRKRKYVFCISHNVWNDGYASAALVNHNKRHVIPTGVTWIQITDQNQFLSTGPFGRPSNDQEWQPWTWLKDSDDPNLNFLWEMLRTTTRADCSDAGMTYFLMTGDEQPEISKLKSLLMDHQKPTPLDHRNKIRMEAENFQHISHFDIDFRNDRQVSQRIDLSLSAPSGLINTRLKEPYISNEAEYDIEVRHFDRGEGANTYQLYLNDHLIREWQSKNNPDGWVSQVIPGITVGLIDEIKLFAKKSSSSELKVDYIQFNRPQLYDNPEFGFLDDPEAMPGQVIVAGCNPGYLKYNGGGPVFLSGPDNPEAFLFEGTLNADGTRSGGNQEQMIARMAQNGVNAFHCQMFRMQRCNIKNEGDDTHAPFIDHDPAKGLNTALLDQWDGWLELFEQNGIIVHLEFYNDARGFYAFSGRPNKKVSGKD